MKKMNFWYFWVYIIFYSIVGFILETCFGFFSKGIIESRQSFLYGPFCFIYGIGAVLMIIFLENEKNIWKIFGFGVIIGAVSEYVMSLFCEIFFGVKWWDYSEYFLNINGRTCLTFGLMWGILAVILIKYINPFVSRTIANLSNKKIIFKSILTCLIGFFIFDAILTGYALKVFYYRVAIENNLNIENRQEIYDKYSKINTNKNLNNFIKTYFGDRKMVKTYPNLMIEEKDNNIVYVDSLYKDKKIAYIDRSKK